MIPGIPWLEIIVGVLKFPEQVLALVKLLKDTPAESREKIMARIKDESDQLAKTGRPKWD